LQRGRTLPSGGVPFVQSINRSVPTGPTTNATSVSYAVTFSEAVTGVDPTDFTLALTGSVAATTPAVVSGTGSVYTVTVSGITGIGTPGLNLVDNNSIRDLAGDGLVQPNAPAAFLSPTSFDTGAIQSHRHGTRRCARSRALLRGALFSSHFPGTTWPNTTTWPTTALPLAM